MTQLIGKDNPKFIDRTGEKHMTNEGYEAEIIEYRKAIDLDIKFSDGTILKNIHYGNLIKGTVGHPYHKSVNGVGYKGVGRHKSKEKGKDTKVYKVWNSIMERGYSTIFKKKHPNYKDVTVCEEWHNFQNFGDWFETNYNPKTMQGWHIDKDILVKGNRVYSSTTCCFVPLEINSMFTVSRNNKYPTGVHYHIRNKTFTSSINRRHLGSFDTPEEAFQVYKVAKEKHIKEVADKWKDFIDPRVYQAMYNYEVEITD